VGLHRAEVRLGAGGGQDGETAGGKAEGADAIGVDMAPVAPGAEHIVGQHLQLARPFPDFHRMAGVMPAVAVVGQRGGDEAGLGERNGGVEMADERAAVAVGDDDQRQVVTFDRGIRGDGLRGEFDHLRLGRGVGGIPDADLDRRAFRIGDEEVLEADGRPRLRRDGEGKEDGEDKGDQVAHGCSGG